MTRRTSRGRRRGRMALGGGLGVLLGVVLAAGSAVLPPALGGQDLARQVAAAGGGWVRFAFEAREGVCGNGEWISIDGERRIGRFRGDTCDCACEEGPVRIEMRLQGGAIRELDAEVGGEWGPRPGPITDLGMVPPAEASAFLLDVAETAGEEVGEDAILPATLARGVETWPRLLEIARGGAPTDVRRQAVFWLGQAASERAAEGLTSLIEDADELEVREHAIFALSQREELRALDALMRVARTSPEPELRRRAIFWLGQRGDDPRVLDLLEEILTRGG